MVITHGRRLQWGSGLSYSRFWTNFVKNAEFTKFRYCTDIELSPRSEGVRTSYLARVGFGVDIFDKSFLWGFPRKISHL